MIGESGYEVPHAVAIFGAGWHGRTVLANFQDDGFAHQCVFLDDKYWGTSVDGIPVVGPRSILDSWEFVSSRRFIVGIGDTKVRWEIAQLIKARGGEFCISMHPSSVVCHNTKIGTGSVIMPGAVIGTGVQIGEHCIINNGTTIGHATHVMDGASVCDGVHTAGSVVIEQEAFVGIGVSISNNVRIGARAIVGIGAFVIEDVPPDVTVAGCPAKIIAHRGTREWIQQ